MATDDDEAHPSRDKLRSDMLRAGWPNSSSYAQGMQYADRLEAISCWEDFLSDVCEAALMRYIDPEVLIRLGPLASVSVPRALNLIGFIPSEEGGMVVDPPLPDYWQWPVLSADPETGG